MPKPILEAIKAILQFQQVKGTTYSEIAKVAGKKPKEVLDVLNRNEDLLFVNGKNRIECFNAGPSVNQAFKQKVMHERGYTSDGYESIHAYIKEYRIDNALDHELQKSIPEWQRYGTIYVANGKILDVNYGYSFSTKDKLPEPEFRIPLHDGNLTFLYSRERSTLESLGYKEMVYDKTVENQLIEELWEE